MHVILVGMKRVNKHTRTQT